MDLTTGEFIAAIERLHNCRAYFRQSIPITESFQGRTVWEGFVHLFELEGHPQASVCYAWSSPVEGSDRRKVYAVLGVWPITTPEEAVRASIIQEARQKRREG